MKLILGTVQFGLDYGVNSIGRPSQNHVFDILETAYEKGIRELDTAEVYGNACELIGDYHRNHRTFDVMSKFCLNKDGYSFVSRVTEAIKTLAVDKIKGYYFHKFEDFLNFNSHDEIRELKREDKIKYLGVSIYTKQEFKAAIDSPDIDVIQIPFNVLDNYQKKGKLIHAAKQKGKLIYARSTFLQGLFFKDPEKLPDKFLPLQEYLKGLSNLTKEYNLTMLQLALGYCLSIKEIDNVIIGIDSKKQLIEILESADILLPSELIDRINLINVLNDKLLNPSCWS